VGGHLAKEIEDGLHLRTRAEHVLEAARPRSVLHGAVFLLQLHQIHATLQQENELVHLHWLAEKIVGAGPDGTQGILLVALAGDDDHLGL
jgi:hypothetical protein